MNDEELINMIRNDPEKALEYIKRLKTENDNLINRINETNDCLKTILEECTDKS